MAQMLLNRENGAPLACRRADGIDRLFEELTRGFGIAYADADVEFAPTIDVAETPAAWRLVAELPGVAPADVLISVTGNVLTLRGEKKSEAKDEGENWRRSERRYGKFVRTFEFAGDVDASRVEARFRLGVLTIDLPKAEQARAKTVTVKVE